LRGCKKGGGVARLQEGWRFCAAARRVEVLRGCKKGEGRQRGAGLDAVREAVAPGDRGLSDLARELLPLRYVQEVLRGGGGII